MARQNSIQQRLQRYSPVYHREEGRNKGEIFLDRIKKTPVFTLWDPSNSSAACTTAAQMKTIEQKVSTLQKTYTYTMKSNRVDRFVADDSFAYQLAFSLNAETQVEATETSGSETKKPEQEAAQKAKAGAPSN